MRFVSLTLLLFAFWLLLSGIYKTHLILFGVLATAASVWVASRVGTVDDEGHPMQLFRGAVTYWPWLAWEIVKAAWSTALVIVHPKLPISPAMTEVQSTQRTPAGLATYGNSITLTPGTITTDVKGRRLTVHALVAEGAYDLEAGDMDRRVTQFEGEA